MLFHEAKKQMSRAGGKEFACCSKLFFDWRSEPFTFVFELVSLHIRRKGTLPDFVVITMLTNMYNKPVCFIRFRFSPKGGREAATLRAFCLGVAGRSGAVALKPVRLWRAAGRLAQSAAAGCVWLRAGGGGAGWAVAA